MGWPEGQHDRGGGLTIATVTPPVFRGGLSPRTFRSLPESSACMALMRRSAIRSRRRLLTVFVLMLMLHHTLDDGIVCGCPVVDKALYTLGEDRNAAWQPIWAYSAIAIV